MMKMLFGIAGCLGWMLLFTGSVARSDVPWEHDFQSALQKAAQSQRLVLLHFWDRGCAPCAKMEEQVFRNPEVGPSIVTDYVPVKINIREYPNLKKKFSIRAWPSDIILDSQGQEIFRCYPKPDPRHFLTTLSKIASQARTSNPQARPNYQTNQNSVGGPPPSQNFQRPQGPQQFESANPFAGSSQRIVSSKGPISQQSPPIPPTPASDQAAGPPLGLDGFCPVTLTATERWQPGDVQFGAIHRGRTYLFIGHAEQQAFLADPDRFAPMLSGFDAVQLIERQQYVQGHRAYGVFHRNRVYLFASEQSLQQFFQRPDFYDQQAMEMLLRATNIAQ